MSAELSALQRAALAIEELRRRLAVAEAQAQAARAEDAIAIVGLACRFPGGADSPAAFWDLLASGRDAVGATPPERWSTEPGASISVTRGGFLREVRRFDARFFDIPPREAAHMDPQHRLLLECAWHALEDAGLPPDRLAGTPVGVYLGLSTSDYGQMLLTHPDLSAYYLTGNPLNAAAGRISHTLGLTGPSVVFDTACSSAAVAIHHAAQALLQGDCEVAIAGGANLILSPRGGAVLAASGQLAADGRCKTFDASADGYVRGEGIGLVVLRRRTDLAPGERAHALLLGSATTHDGASSGFTVPSGRAQQRAVELALRRAGVAPREVDFVECHGTGTSLGDPIEVRALAEVFTPGREPGHPITLGAVKTHLGHLEAAAASAGLIKTVLALQHESVPANLHLKQPNPDIPWSDMPLEPARQARPWPRGAKRRVAGVNSFGASGTNVHLVVAEAALPEPPATDSESRAPLALSAKSPEALMRLAAAYADLLAAGVPFADLARNAALRRGQLPWRIALSSTDAQDQLRALASGQGLPNQAVPRSARFSFVFPDSGDVRNAVAQAQAWRERGVLASRCTGLGRGLLAAAIWTGAASLESALAWLESPAPRTPLRLIPSCLAPLTRADGSALEAVLTDADLAAVAEPQDDGSLWWIQDEDARTLTDRLRTAFLAGARLEWSRILDQEPVAWTDLPLYPFAGDAHWFCATPPVALAENTAQHQPVPAPVPLSAEAHPTVLAQLFEQQLMETGQALQSVVAQQLTWLRATRPPADPAADTYQLLLFSASDEKALHALFLSTASALDSVGPEQWKRCAAELRDAVRPDGTHAMLVAESPADAAAVLHAAARGERARRLVRVQRPSQPPRLSALFSGLGDQYPGMGAELYRRLPTFRSAFDRCATVLRPHLPCDLHTAVFQEGSALQSTRLAHPALLALQCALIEQWRAWGIVPDDALGYSLGDYASAVLAGVFSEAAALRLVAARAALIETQTAGAMLAVPLSAEALSAHLPPSAYVAALVTPATTVAAGTPEAIAELTQRLAAAHIPARPLQAAHAFHCPLLAPLSAPLHALVSEARPQAPRLPILCGATGQALTAEQAQSPDFWIRHTLEPVRFAQGLESLLADPNRFFLEVGPGLALSSFVFQHPGAAALSGRPVAASIPNRDDAKHETAFLLETLGRLWLAGFSPDWRAVTHALSG